MEKIYDSYKEHWCHQSFHSDCSECFKENRTINAWKTVNIPQVEFLDKDWAKNIMNKIIWGEDTDYYEK